MVVEPVEEESTKVVCASARNSLHTTNAFLLQCRRVRSENKFRRRGRVFRETGDGQILMIQSGVIRENFLNL